MEDMQRRNNIHVIGGPEEEKPVKQNVLNYSPSTLTKNRKKNVYLNLRCKDSEGTWGKLINFDILIKLSDIKNKMLLKSIGKKSNKQQQKLATDI